MVRSKSEVIIANKLYARRIPYAYEQELRLQGARRLPDFTIDDAGTGRTIYWEHMGMLRDAAYRQSWEEKKAWYRSADILPLDDDEERGNARVDSGRRPRRHRLPTYR